MLLQPLAACAAIGHVRSHAKSCRHQCEGAGWQNGYPLEVKVPRDQVPHGWVYTVNSSERVAPVGSDKKGCALSLSSQHLV